jgi:hypothetical protein
MATRVLLTVDTELVWRHHVAGHGWKENFRRSYDPAGVGVPFQLATLAEHGLKGCFFVDPMPAAVHGLDPVKRMVEPILEAGQEVQLHLHPFWAHLEQAEREGKCPELTSFDLEAQRALIERAQALLIEAGAPPPIAFRSGSYAADTATLEALAAVGLRYDSSHNGCHPKLSRLPFDRSLVAPFRAGALIEVPVGQIEERTGQLRHLQICAVSIAEMSGALAHAARESHPVTTIVSHSFELATRDGLRQNGLVHGRFLRLCRFLADNRDVMPTVWFSDLDGVPLDDRKRNATPPPHGRPGMGRRAL